MDLFPEGYRYTRGGAFPLRRRARKASPLRRSWHAKRDGEVCTPRSGGMLRVSALCTTPKPCGKLPVRKSSLSGRYAPAPLKGSPPSQATQPESLSWRRGGTAKPGRRGVAAQSAHRRVGCTLADRTQKSLPLVTKGRWHGEAVTEGIRSGEDRKPTIPQSACG